jgi:hypothetical protein
MTMLGEAKVTVTVTSDTGEVWVYDVPRIKDFEVNVEKDYDTITRRRRPALSIMWENPVRSIKFSMVPLLDDTGQYMTAKRRLTA